MDANHDLEARSVPDLCQTCGGTQMVPVADPREWGPMARIGGAKPCPDCASPASPAIPEPPAVDFEACGGMNGQCQQRAGHDGPHVYSSALHMQRLGITGTGLGLNLPEPAPALPVEGADSDRIEAARVKRWTYVHAATDNPTEDGIWKAINDRIGWGYSGVSGARESECNQDIRDAIAAIRADERRVAEARIAELEALITAHICPTYIDAEAAEERERVLREALEQYREAMRLTREYVGENLLPALPGWSWYDADENARALLTPEDSNKTQEETR